MYLLSHLENFLKKTFSMNKQVAMTYELVQKKKNNFFLLNICLVS